jgi:drug/metabolite transporter (DMT)-like permease
MRGLLWVALGASLWGTDTVLRRPLTARLSSIEIVLIEHLILALLLLPAWVRCCRTLTSREWLAVLGIAWGGSALGTLCFTEAIRLGNPTTAVLLQKTQPLFAALLARLLLGEPLGRRFWAWLALASGAAYLISFGISAPFHLRGEALLALVAAMLWGTSTVLGRFLLYRLGAIELTAMRIAVAVPLLVLLAWAGRREFTALDGKQAVSLVAIALVPGLAALLIYYHGLKRTRASLAAVAELSFPATAALLNWTVLGARVSAIQLAGFALLWVVILTMERGKGDRASAA